ncbi:FAD-dependent oxidoreductase [Clostridium luticellarii]|jgi:threonine dehydrogenase-like Zn-dependent dehydrogenase|uniref:tRNA uridine 5-carboxymethylaminomethyl modification enzyme GidA n=1 Tax=Clostridium luticellarii TaxID=1691940 RepID=A0A2T0BEF6_9CLOT|nr:FAD-dependent oxidoreductase [Clostridium luticellarii]PRR82280.1 tRNA uridine 5-carboxymethylaminomethyl modification enzyme GidA [Clostridium luticellarii]
MKVIIIGCGWSGAAAALTARKAGADVVVYEKTDMVLGLGNVGGIMRNNGRYTAAEEIKALGAGDLIGITDSLTRHKNLDFPNHAHAWLYDVNKIEPAVRNYILSKDIKLNLMSRVVDVKMDGNKIKGIYTSEGDYDEADVFIETTGSTGPMGNCIKYGNGCSMCVLRCPSFGPRISISSCAGVEDLHGERSDGNYGAFSGSCKLAKETLDKELVEEVEEKGVVVLKVPEEDINLDKLKAKVCQQYALKEFAENIILLDTGHVKLMTSYYPLDKLRKIHGLENVKFIDPYSGGKGNSIRYLSVAPVSNDLKVTGVENLFCGGEKSGLFVGHTEAICTGSLAGHNAVRYTLGIPALILPTDTVIGDIIDYANRKIRTSEGRKNRYTFAGAKYFNRMKERGLYTIDKTAITHRISSLNLSGILSRKLL